MLGRFLIALFLFPKRHLKLISWSFLGFVVAAVIISAGNGIYQGWDDDPDRGAIAITDGAFGESYKVPEYLDQGWDEADSLWFYNTTQGSALLPYDFFLVLEQPGLKKAECERNGENAGWFLCDQNVDRFRYLPQKDTFFNPDALPVGFVKERYRGKDYVGFTCAACHTAQINFTNPGDDTARALRIDGGPAMADMVGFLTELARSMKQTRRLPDSENPRLDRFVKRVLSLNNDYKTRATVEEDLKKWTDVLDLYNTVNRSTHGLQKVKYGYARLDAFGMLCAWLRQPSGTALPLLRRQTGAPSVLKGAQVAFPQPRPCLLREA